MVIKKRILSSVCLLLLLFAFLLSLGYIKRRGADRQFEALSQEILQDSYEKDSLSLHFAFRDPAQFGIDDSGVHLPCYDRSSYLQEPEKTRQLLSLLEATEADKLSAETAETYEILQHVLQKKAEGADYLYFEEPLSPTGGIHFSLPVLLAEYAMEDREDVENYLKLLRQIPTYFESLAAYEADKAAAGMFMAAEDVNTVISQCDFMASESGSDLYAACFAGQLKTVCEPGSEAYAAYEAEQKQIFDTLVGPAYEKLADALSLLKDTQKEQRGLCRYEGGRDYYEYRIQTLIGTDKTCEEISDILIRRTADLYTQLAALRSRYDSTLALGASPATQDNTSSPASEMQSQNDTTAPAQTLTDPADAGKSQTEYDVTDIDTYIPALQENLKKDFPMLPESTPVSIKQIPDALKAYTAPAYYFIPRIQMCRPGRIDGIENIIYYNRDACQDPVSLYTTLAHEGFPGHMYQNNYFIASHGVSASNMLRYSLDFPGYSEGWAMYTELLAYENAAAFTGQDETYCKMLRLSREIQLCVLCYLDIQIHADQATLPGVAPFLAKIGVKDPAAVSEVYTYLVNEPGTYLKYYMGYLELLECKKLFRQRCEEAGKDYSDLAFHTFFLEHGPDTYVRIREKILQ